jgi:hypothetical protein
MIKWWVEGQDLLEDLREDNDQIQSKPGTTGNPAANAWFDLTFAIAHNPEFADIMNSGFSTASATVTKMTNDAKTYLQSIPAFVPDGNGGTLPLMSGDRPATMFDVMSGATLNITFTWTKYYGTSSGKDSPVLSTDWCKAAFEQGETAFTVATAPGPAGESKNQYGIVTSKWATVNVSGTFSAWSSSLEAGAQGDPTALNDDAFVYT